MCFCIETVIELILSYNSGASDRNTYISSLFFLVFSFFLSIVLLKRGNTDFVLSMDEGLTIYYQNVRGLRTKTYTFFNSILNCNYDVVVLTETWLNEGVLSSELFDDRFIVYRQDVGGGVNLWRHGVLIAINKRLRSELCHDLSSNQIACISIGVRIIFPRNISIFINAIYFPPATPSNLYLDYCEHIESLSNVLKNNLLIVGDFNLPEINSSTYDLSQGTVKAKILHQLMNFYELDSFNSVRNVNYRTLDLVLSNLHLDVIRDDDPLVPEDNHHPALQISMVPLSTLTADYTHESTTVGYDFRKGDFSSLYVKLRDLDWESLYSCTNVDTAVDLFYAHIYSCFNDCIPKRKIRSTNSKYPPWFTRDIIADLKKKNKCSRKRKFSVYHNNVFKGLRSSLKVRIEHEHRNYLNRIETEVKNNIKNFWAYVNSKRKSFSPENMMNWNNITYCGPEIAGGFADFFRSVYNQSSVDCCKVEDLRNVESLTDVVLGSISSEEVVAGIRSLKSSGLGGPDGVPSFIVKGCSEVLIEPLKFIFNLSISTSCFPSKWKVARVVPIFKSGHRNNIANYRPISILNNFAKVFERIIYSSIFRQVRHVISDKQHGFLPGRSTTTNLMVLTNELSSVLDKGGQMDVIYMDFTKAFDTVSHAVLLEKLNKIGFNMNLIKLMKSYLKDRTQYVSISNVKSPVYQCTSGVPQGSNLGPLLFLMFINDLPLNINESMCLMFADDVKVFKPVMRFEDCRKLQEDVNNISCWCHSNKLNLNISKCCVLTFTRQHNPLNYTYNVSGINLDKVASYKDLGVVFNANLSFNPHIESLVAKANRQLGFIMRTCCNFSDTNTFSFLYKALVRSILEYAVEVWNPYTCDMIIVLERMQNKFLRLLFFKTFGHSCPREFPTSELRAIFRYDSLKLRREVKSLSFLYNVLNNKIDCIYFTSKLNIYVSPIARRTSFSFFIPRSRTVNNYNTPLIRIPRLFNSICNDLDVFWFSLPEYRRRCFVLLGDSS
jgi:hypothetical protein